MRDWVERDVRRMLDIPFNASAASVAYEHSMGQGANALPAFVLRRSSGGVGPRAKRPVQPASPG
ncbi:MAG: hypothetical protein E4H11_07935, partial [Myxococcales bacterium]